MPRTSHFYAVADREPLLESYDSEKTVLPRLQRSRYHALLSIKAVVISTAIVASVVMSYVAQGWKLDRESADAMVALNFKVTPAFFGPKKIDGYGRLRRQTSSVTCSSGPEIPGGLAPYDWSNNDICMKNAEQHANCIRVCDSSFSTCGGCDALAADRANQYAIASANCAYKASFVCDLRLTASGDYDYVALSSCCLQSRVPGPAACLCEIQQSASASCFLNGLCSPSTCQTDTQTCTGTFSTAPLSVCSVAGALTCTGTGSSEVDLTCGTVGGNQYYLNSATSQCVSSCPSGFDNDVVGGVGTCSATVGSSAVIQVSDDNNKVLGYVGATSSGAYTISPSISDALSFTLSDSGSPGLVGIASNLGGYLGVSVSAAQVLTTAATSRLRARSSEERLVKRVLTIDQVSAFVVTQAAPDAAYFAIVDAAGLAYATAATAAYDAAFSITGLPLAAPALAAETTYATATVMAAWTACVAYKAAWTTAYTAYDAAAYPDNPTSVAADAAALAIATAAAAGAGPTSSTTCGQLALLYTTAYSPSDAKSAAASSHAAALAVNAELVALVSPAVVAVTPDASSASAYAPVIPTDGASNIWSLNGATNQLSATYTNADGSVISSVTFFAQGTNLAVTGNLDAYNSATGTSAAPLTLTWIYQ